MARIHDYDGYEKRGDSRISQLKWLSIILLFGGLLLFVLTIVIMILQIQAFVNGEYDVLAVRYSDAGLLIGSVDIFIHTTTAIVLIVVCIGAASTGISLSSRDDATHNISVKNALIGQCMMTSVAAIFYMIGTGSVYFLVIDKYIEDFGDLKELAEWYYASLVCIIIFFIFAFAVAIVAIATYFLGFTYRLYPGDKGASKTNSRSGFLNHRHDRDHYSDYITDKGVYADRGHLYPYRAPGYYGSGNYAGNYATYY